MPPPKRGLPLAHSRHKVTSSFTVQVSVSEDRTTWQATCLACGEHLNVSHSTQLVVLKLDPNLTVDQVTEFKRQWASAAASAVGWKQPIMACCDVEVLTPQGVILQEVLATHTTNCQGRH